MPPSVSARIKILMKHAQPRVLSRRRVQQLLAETKAVESAGARMEEISRKFLRCPYTANLLVGSAETPEAFTVSLDEFDCVTYVETVLAFSQAATVDEFADLMRRIRYEGGRIQWNRRNHYMSVWVRNNLRAGLVRKISAPVPNVSKDRILDMVPGLPSFRMRFDCIPKGRLPRVSKRLKTGDLIFFASTRPHLDVFHCGILVCNADRLLLRHASRSQGGVVEQELSEFLKKNRMAGVIVVRPVDLRASGRVAQEPSPAASRHPLPKGEG